MSDPEIPSKRERTLSVLLVNNLIVSALVFALLEIWRPFYFLTDDNLGGCFPLLSGMGHRLAEGKSPFVADYIFGGNYDLLRDCSLSCWHPVYLLASLLANTPAHFLMVDLVAFIFLMTATAGFVNLAHFLRQELALQLSDARLMLYALSFNYSMIVLTTGSSWIGFLGNHSALPWLALGILQTSWRRGLCLVTFFSLHHILGGHIAPTISDSIFLSLFAVGISIYRRSFLPLISWVSGYAIALLILSPFLIPAWHGFLMSDRSDGLTVATMSKFAVPAMLFPFSYFFSTFSVLLFPHYQFGTTQLFYSSAFVSCAAAWAIIPAAMSRKRWRFLEILCLGLLALLAVMIVRPLWVSSIMLHLPLLKSMRWPFREILQFQFFLHLFLVMRPLGGSARFQRLAIFAGVFIFVFPLIFLNAPTFLPMQPDRELLFSGKADLYWNRVKPLLKPDDCVAVIADINMIDAHPFEIPYTLLEVYNFPILAKTKNVSGYSVTVPRDQLYVKIVPVLHMGIFGPEQKAALLKERPDVKFITLESVKPLRITLSSRDGPVTDLKPFVAP